MSKNHRPKVAADLQAFEDHGITLSTPESLEVAIIGHVASDDGATVEAILRQDYPGAWSIILVDDESTDGTAEVAHRVATAFGISDEAMQAVLAFYGRNKAAIDRKLADLDED